MTPLNVKTELLNDALRAAEAAIAALGYGVTAEVPIPGTDTHLRFTKEGPKWLLMIVHPGGVTTLLSASRALRVASVMALPDLTAALYEETRKQEKLARFNSSAPCGLSLRCSPPR